MKGKWILIGVITLVALVVAVSGCVSDDSAQNTTTAQPQPTTNYTIITCPNPDCILHNPIAYRSGYGGSATPRPIMVNTYRENGGYHHTYLCQVCGAEWSD